MRLDDFLSTIGVIKRRTAAKEMAQNGLVMVNGQAVKPAYQVKIHDIIQLKGSHPFALEVLDIPSGSVAKEARSEFFKELSPS